MSAAKLLKKDLFGEISVLDDHGGRFIVRDTGAAALPVRWLARRLLRNEARVLAALEGVDGVPRLCAVSRDRLSRSYLPGMPMQVSRPTDPAYFRTTARLLRRLHRAGVVHNDLAKEPNVLVLDDGGPAFVDFQLAWFLPRRGRLFRVLAYEDLRHLLKHKRTYCPERLTARERKILANPGVLSRVWRRSGKPVYLFITRSLLGWADREGAGDRGGRG